MWITLGANAKGIYIKFWSYNELMENNYTAVIKQDGGWWIGWIKEIPGVNCQESTREELLKTLRVSLGEALEFNRQDALEIAGTNYEEELIAV